MSSKKVKGSSGAAFPADDRRSGRLRTKVRVRSVVDPETRRLVAQQRLVALEQDNYEEGAAHLAAGDAAYEEEEDEEVAQGGSKGKKRKRGPTAGSRGAAAAAAGDAPAAGKGADRAAKATVYRTRNLDHVVAEEVSKLTRKVLLLGVACMYAHCILAATAVPLLCEQGYDSDGVNYKTIAASVPSAHACNSAWCTSLPHALTRVG